MIKMNHDSILQFFSNQGGGDYNNKALSVSRHYLKGTIILSILQVDDFKIQL